MYRYHAYGLNIVSEIECCGLKCHPSSNSPDVTVMLGEVAESLDSPALTGPFYQVAPHDFLLHIEGIAHYHVSDGRRIVVGPFPEARPEEVSLFLMGSAMGALLYQRGVFLLHGSAIETDRGAMVFVGPSGIGKSTLAAKFQFRGYRLLSDDICALVSDGAGRVKVLPAFPHLRLCPDVYERFSETASAPPEAHFDQDKFILSLSDDYSQEPRRLRGIYVLAQHDLTEIVIKGVAGFHRVGHLLVNLYRPEYLPGMATKDDMMKAASAIARAIEINQVFSFRDTTFIDDLADCLESEWQRRETRTGINQ